MLRLRAALGAVFLFAQIACASAGVLDYNATAASNTSVGGVSIAEGMARASVNNAIRAQLSDIAKLLLDQGGAVATTGSANAYLLSLNSAPTVYADNMLFLATANHSNSGAATININSLGLKDIEKVVLGSTVALAANDFPFGHIGLFVYSGSNNSIVLLNPALVSSAYIPGGTDVAIADGGTGQSTAITAFNALSPMTSRGDLIRGGVSGAERVGLGASATFLRSDGTDAAWAALSDITTGMFAANVVDTDTAFAANSDTRLASQRAIKSYVDTAAAGITWAVGGSVATATTANITLSGEQTLDGVLTSTSRVLVKNQTAATENGPYLSGPAGWTRTTDADTGAEFIRLGVFITGGTTQAGTTFVSTRTTAPTLGVDNIAFVQNGTSAVYTAGTMLELSGNQFNVVDAELLALGGVASAADKVPYFTGAGTAAVVDFTAAGRALLDDAAASNQRTTLGLAIGTDVQAFDADLTTYAGITPSAAVQSVLDDASIAAMNATMGQGTGDTPTLSGLTVTDEAYTDAGFNGDLTVPTKNAVRDLNVTGRAAFRVYLSAEQASYPDNVGTTNINFAAEVFDQGASFGPGLWTPPAGIVHIGACAQVNGTYAAGANGALWIYKNAVALVRGAQDQSASTASRSACVNVIDLAESGDNYSVRGIFDFSSGTGTVISGANTTYFFGAMQ